MNKIGQYIYLGWWFVRARLFGRKAPLQTVLFITDVCNLKCKHCSVHGIVGGQHRRYEDIVSDLQYSYGLGSRFVDIEGGEPTLWREGDKTINDIIRAAKEIGFFSITITTNAQQDFSQVHMDSLWVSMDGVGKYHEAVRGEGTFARLETNIRHFAESQAHFDKRMLTVNMVVNNLNKDGLSKAMEYVRRSPYIGQISVNFHTPFPGTEALMLSDEDKCRALDTVLDYKRRGYPIMNSRSGLKKMYPDYMQTHPVGELCWVTNFIYPNGQRGLCVGIQQEILRGHVSYVPTDTCKQCGFCMSGEMASVFHFCPDTLLAGFKLRM
ncbi:MAG: radical SAM protein [Paludibacteraceae bacterium]|nr:radical SAM protein [Paludibacteraceae bacterium]